MKTIRKIFSIAVVVCVILMQIAPALPAYAFDVVEVNPDNLKKVDAQFAKEAVKNKTVKTADWSQADWDSEIVLLSDLKKYRQELAELAEAGKENEAKNLQPRKVKLNSDEALDYYQVPGEVRKVVSEYRDNTGLFTKKDGNSKDLLKSYIQSLLPVESLATTETQGNQEERFVDIGKMPKINVKNIKADDSDVRPVEFTIKNRELKIKKHPLQDVTIKGISEQVKQRGLSGKKISVGETVGLFAKINNFVLNLFKIETANAEVATDLIAYYNGIENNILDNALYYISRSQAEGGAFAQVSTYEETAETALALAGVGRTDSTQFADSLNYLITAEPQNVREMAIKARLMEGLGQPYQTYLDEFIANENSDHGYGLDVGYESDILTTMEGALAMYTANYSIQDKLPLALYYVLSHIPANGALKYKNDGPASYYLINKIVQYLKPFKSMNVANDQGVNIYVQDKINVLLNYLSSQFDDDDQKLLGTTDIIDEMMALETWKMYNVEPARQAILENKLQESQYINGSFGNSLRATAYSLQTLDKPDLILTNLQSTGILQSRQTASFAVTIENQGYAPASDAIIYIFADNVYNNLSLNLGAAGITIEPNESVNINFTISTSETNKYIGAVDLKFYIETGADVNYDNNWLYSSFNFSPASDGTPALPMYYAVFKYSLNGNPAIIATIPPVQKTDANRSGYVLGFKEHSATSWQWTSYNPNLYIIGYFPEGAYYDFTIGVLNANGSSITYFSNVTTVHLSANNNLYTGAVSGRITLDNQNMPNTYAFIQANLSTSTNANGEFYQSGGHNGRVAAWIDKTQYEQFRQTFNVQEGQTTQNIRLFTHLKPDTQAPTLSSTQLRWANNYKVKNQTEYSLFNWGSDNIALKEGDFYLWNPVEELWIFLGTVSSDNSGYATMKWYVPTDLPLTTGYKIKGVLRDYRDNESNEAEWGPFEIIDGTPPIFSVVTPNGGEEWMLGTTNTISWNTTSTGGVSKVNLYYEYPNSYNGIAYSINNSGLYNWYIPYNSMYVGNQFKIRVSGNDGVNFLSGLDNSDNYFTVKDPSPKPADPWQMPNYLSLVSTTAPLFDVGNYQLAFDNEGVAHLVYRYIEDFVVSNPRIIVERLYYSKFQNNIWSEPQVIYEKNWETDSNLNGYLPIGDLKLELVGSNPNLIWRSMGGSGGCISFNGQEIYNYYFNGINWVGPINLSNNNTTSDIPDSSVDNNGNLTAVWTDGRIWDENCSVTGTQKIMYSAKSVSGNWGAINSFNDVQSPYSPKLAVTTGNKVNLVVLAGTENAVKHYTLSGGNWTNAKTVPGSNVDYPILRAYQDKLYYAYRNYYNDPQLGWRSRILYTNFDGSSWQPLSEVTPVAVNMNYNYPNLAVDDQGNPHIIFHTQDQNSGNGRALLTWTTRLKNNTWLVPQEISLQSQYVSSGSPALAGSGQNIVAVWNVPYSSKTKLAYNKIDLNINYIPPQPVTGLVGQSTTNSIRLSWDQYQDVDGDFHHFSILRGLDEGEGSIVFPEEMDEIATSTNINLTSYTDYNAVTSPGNIYVVAVYDTAGNIAYGDLIDNLLPNIVYPEIAVAIGGSNVDNNSAYNFGEWYVGDNKTIQIVVSNNSEVDLGLQPRIASSTGDCVFDNDQKQIVVDPFSSVTYNFKIYGDTLGNKACSFVLDNNDPDQNPFTLNFNGRVLSLTEPIFALPFDENSGSLQFVDSLNNTLAANCSSTPTCPSAGISGKINTAIRFDGNNDYLGVSNNPVLNLTQAITLEAWIKPDDVSGDNTPWMVVAAKGDDSYELTISKSMVLYASILNQSGARVSLSVPNAITMNRWNHIAMTYDGANIKVYVNGVLKGAKAQTGLIVNNTSSGLLIGQLANNYHFKGLLDEFKIYDKALTGEELLNHYSASPVSPYFGPLEVFFEEEAGSLGFFDLSTDYKFTCASAITCPSTKTTGKVNQSIKFDGVDDKIILADTGIIKPESNLTIEAWIKPDTVSNEATPWMVVATKGLDYELTVSKNGVLYASLVNQAGVRATLSVSNAVKLNQWNHIALTYDGANLKVYSNGALKGSKAQTGLIKNNASPLIIGQYGNRYQFKGELDEFKLYRDSLSEEEILAHYNAVSNIPFIGPLEFSFENLVNSNTFFDLTEDYKLTCASSSTCPFNGLSGKIGKDVEFDGLDDYLSMADSDTINPTSTLTVEAWIKPDIVSNDNTPWMVVATKGLDYELTISKNGVAYVSLVNQAGARAIVSASGAIVMNQWNHLVMTYDGANLKVYVNGILKGTKPQTGLIKTNKSQLTIGQYVNAYHFKGLLDEFKLYNRALTEEEIVAHYNGL